MPILDIIKACEKDHVAEGVVMITETPQVRSGKKNDFMVGRFTSKEGSAEFKIWEERDFAIVRDTGPGLYYAEVCGSEFNGVYLTVRRIWPYEGSDLDTHMFLPEIPKDRLTALWTQTTAKLHAQGVSDRCWALVKSLISAPELEGRFQIEGAAVHHHDNKIGGLLYHTTKMLNLLSSLLENEPSLLASADLLTLGIVLHDIGKVYEYQDLSPGPHWYANHRVRGIEFLAAHKEAVLAQYDEAFYRQIQSIISGHHGIYGDRPTTVAAGIVHYIDTLESQVTGLLQVQRERKGKFRYAEWGFLAPIPLDDDEEDSKED